MVYNTQIKSKVLPDLAQILLSGSLRAQLSPLAHAAHNLQSNHLTREHASGPPLCFARLEPGLPLLTGVFSLILQDPGLLQPPSPPSRPRPLHGLQSAAYIPPPQVGCGCGSALPRMSDSGETCVHLHIHSLDPRGLTAPCTARRSQKPENGKGGSGEKGEQGGRAKGNAPTLQGRVLGSGRRKGSAGRGTRTSLRGHSLRPLRNFRDTDS